MSIENRDELASQVRVIQIILAALAMGILVFGAVAVYVQATNLMAEEGGEPSAPITSYLAIGFGLIAVILGVVLPGIITAQSPPTIETYQTGKIITGALFEGPAFFNLIAYMLEGQTYSLAIAGILMVFILLQIPNVDRVREWLDMRARQARDSDSFGQ